ncbi:hypothetical protein Tco_0957620, partial [Tanacetum coccineum]
PLRLEIKRKLAQRSKRVKYVDLHLTEPWSPATVDAVNKVDYIIADDDAGRFDDIGSDTYSQVGVLDQLLLPSHPSAILTVLPVRILIDIDSSSELLKGLHVQHLYDHLEINTMDF